MREKEKKKEGGAQKVQQSVSGLINEAERAAGRSDAQRCNVVCSLTAMFPMI